MYVVGLDVDSRAYFTSATCAISLLYLMNTIVFLQIFSIINIIKNNVTLKKRIIRNTLGKVNINSIIYSKVISTLGCNLNNTFGRVNCIQIRNITNIREDNKLIIYNKYNESEFNLTKGILTKNKRDNIKLLLSERSMLIGILLSDGWMWNKKGWNSSIGLKQSIKHFNYLWFVFIKLSHLCSNTPYLCKNLKRGKLFFSLQFQTRKLLCLNEIKELFYDINISNKKIIKEDLYDYFDYIVLAHWIMGDGAKRNKGTIICTDSFTIKEVVILINILYLKFNINCNIHYDNGKNRINIPNKELLKIKNKLIPYMNKLFYYKIHYFL